MTTEAAWEPRAVRGAGRDRRMERRLADMRDIWAEAWQLKGEGDDDGALELFMDANDLGMSFPVDESRTCGLYGTVALGYARVPFTDWDADVALSHGRDEKRPTALDEWVGWESADGTKYPPKRPTGRLASSNNRLALPAMRTDNGTAQGPEGPFRRIGANRVGARVEFDYARDGSVVMRLATDA